MVINNKKIYTGVVVSDKMEKTVVVAYQRAFKHEKFQKIVKTVKKYKVHTIVPGKVFYVRLKFGFKVEHKVNLMFKEIVSKMQANGEVDEKSHYPSLRKYEIPADFKFVLLNSRLSVDDEITPFEQFVVRAYRVLKNVSLPPAQDFGLDMANVETENVPIYIGKAKNIEMKREY